MPEPTDGRKLRVAHDPIHPDAARLLTDAGLHLILAAPGGPLPEADVLMLRTRPLQPEEVVRFRLIVRHGIGVDNVPLEVARAAGVRVMNTPGANAASVAEQALLLMLALARDLPGQEAAARCGLASPAFPGLEGLRLLVVGFGASGKRIAALGQALGMPVTVQSPRLNGETTAEGYRIARDLESALAEADVVTLHSPLNATTRHLIGAEALARLPAGALVINCARGGLVDETALIAALAGGRLGGAALDVTEEEPLPAGHPLLAAPRLILTPHSGGMADSAFRRMGMEAAQNILDFLAGSPRPEAIVC